MVKSCLATLVTRHHVALGVLELVVVWCLIISGLGSR